MSKARSLSPRWPIRLAILAILLYTAWQYSSAIRFGFWWDDPVWYSHMPGRSWWQLLLPVPEFQYYRPGSMLYVSRFLTNEGTYAVVALHWAQIGWHLLQIALSYAIARRLGLELWLAVVVTLLVALFPFSYQATAWAAPNQPMAAAFQGGAWLLFLIAGQRQHRPSYIASLLLFFLALTLQESSVALAFVPLLLWLAQKLRGIPFFRLPKYVPDWLRNPVKHGWHWPLLYPLVALIFTVAWAQAPRQAGIIGVMLEPKTAVYLLQGVAYPLLARLGGYAPDHSMTPLMVGLIVALTSGGLLWLAARQGRLLPALAGLGWALMSLIPAIVGLRFSYAGLAPRLLHSAVPGIVLLWVCGLWGGNGRRWLTWVGRLLLLLIAIQSGLLLRQFEQLHSVGTTHLQDAVVTMSEANDRLLFINFPDRFSPKRASFPLGYWGMTLAPVVVELDAFPPLLTGATADSTSRSMPWIDQATREASEYDVDMRGVIIQPNELSTLAANYDAVYLTRYEEDGRFRLQEAGGMLLLGAEECLAIFNESLCLHEVDVTQDEDQLQVALTWSTAVSLPPNITFFVHLGPPGQPPLAQADGDSWLGMLPLADWPLQRAIVDLRTLSVPANHVPLMVQVGVYDRVSGERLPGTDVDERPLPGNTFTISP